MSLSLATIGASHVNPGILVQLGDLRYSSRDNITLGGSTWNAAGITKSGPSESGTGRATIDISLIDNTTTWPEMILAGIDPTMTCAVWLYYVTDAGSVETEQIFSGVVRSVRAENDGSGQTISISGITEGPNVSWSPRITWYSPFAVRRGGEVRINAETFILE